MPQLLTSTIMIYKKLRRSLGSVLRFIKTQEKTIILGNFIVRVRVQEVQECTGGYVLGSMYDCSFVVSNILFQLPKCIHVGVIKQRPKNATMSAATQMMTYGLTITRLSSKSDLK